MYPFLPPDRIDHAVLATVREVVAAVPRFDTWLSRVAWFGDAVIWIAPEPDRPFRDLTTMVWRRFPQAPPYAGAHAEIVPHLTIGHDAARPVLQAAAAEVAAQLPVRATINTVRLITGTPNHSPWPTICEFPLAGKPRAADHTDNEPPSGGTREAFGR